MAFIDALKCEIGRLEDELSADPRFVRLQALEALLLPRLAQSLEEKDGGRIDSPAGRKVRRRISYDRRMAEELAHEYVRGRRYPTPIGEIYQALLEKGIELRGAQPTSHLSAILGRSDRMTSLGRAGWMTAAAAEERRLAALTQVRQAD